MPYGGCMRYERYAGSTVYVLQTFQSKRFDEHLSHRGLTVRIRRVLSSFFFTWPRRLDVGR